MQSTADCMLILDHDLPSLEVLRSVANHLGCDHVEAGGLKELSAILDVRRPTIAVLAVDFIEADALAVLHAMAQHGQRPPTLLIGGAKARVLASARRTAELQGLPIIGTRRLPLDELDIERLLTAHTGTPPPISREEVERALGEQEFILRYQPKIALGGNDLRVQGVEALVRWQHPRRGELQPRHFLKAVEAHELLGDLTDFVITDAARQAGVWYSRGMILEMVINLGTSLVKDRAFPDRLAALLRESDLPPGQIVLDINETAGAMDSDLILEVFTRLRLLGVGLSLDNFGTGVSSLMELYRMPFSEIKVDRALLIEVPKEHEADVIVRAITSLAHALEIAVCAEGVETREMLDFVQSAGFDSAQGRLFSGPVTASDIERLLHAWPDSAPSTTGRSGTIRTREVEESTITRRLRRLRVTPAGASK
jgi:EAL domain-containing protein (putative c-di-GMP-specific phosphodiesterase class I)